MHKLVKLQNIHSLIVIFFIYNIRTSTNMRILPHRIDHQAHNGGVLTIFPNSLQPHHTTYLSRSTQRKSNTRNIDIFKHHKYH